MPEQTSKSERAPFVYLVQMDIPAAHEAEFNRVYDTQHVPALTKVPGVRACTRYRLERTNKDGMARYLAMYEVDSLEIIDSPAWLEAAAVGDWIEKIRPHTTNRSHTVMRRVG